MEEKDRPEPTNGGENAATGDQQGRSPDSERQANLESDNISGQNVEPEAEPGPASES